MTHLDKSAGSSQAWAQSGEIDMDQPTPTQRGDPS